MKKEDPAPKGPRVRPPGQCASKQIFMRQWGSVIVEGSTGPPRGPAEGSYLAWGFREAFPRAMMPSAGMEGMLGKGG